MTKEEKELMDEKFKGLSSLMNSQFINVQDRLEEIKIQTTRTNNRVTHNEEEIECIKGELLEYKFLKKYPKAGVILIIVAIILIGMSIFNLKITYKDLKDNVKIEATK